VCDRKKILLFAADPQIIVAIFSEHCIMKTTIQKGGTPHGRE
jgi:hypothetical protein